MKIEVTGTQEAIAKTQKLMTLVPLEIAHQLYIEAELTMTESKKKEVPVDIGTLRDSGFVEEPKMHFSGISVSLGYGGPAVDYAKIVHEDLQAHHKVGKAKYLEDPIKRRSQVILANIFRKMQNTIQRLGI